MKHFENKSQVWFKVLSPEGRDLDNEMRQWSLPLAGQKGEPFISASRIGTWLVSNPKEMIQKNNRVFVAELSKEAPLLELPGIIWVRRTCLIREVTLPDLISFRAYRAHSNPTNPS